MKSKIINFATVNVVLNYAAYFVPKQFIKQIIPRTTTARGQHSSIPKNVAFEIHYGNFTPNFSKKPSE